MSNYSEYFLKSKRNVVKLETLEIRHPNFSQVYRFVRNSSVPISVTLETGESGVIFTYLPIKIIRRGIKDDLDLELEVSLGDVGESIAKEIKNVRDATAIDPDEGFAIYPTCIHREYRSDVLTAPLSSPITLQIENFTYAHEGSTFVAISRRLNNGKTGEIYAADRFPMLKGFMTNNTVYIPPKPFDFIDGTPFMFIDGTRFETET